MKKLLVLGLAPLMGCVVYLRDPEHLEEEAVEIVEGHGSEDLATCYERHLAAVQREIEAQERGKQGPYEDIGPAVSGRVKEYGGVVVVSFTVDKKTGDFSQPTVVEEATTAPEPLVGCVLESLEGLKLEPPDERDGQVTLAWRFEVGKHARDRPAEPAVDPS